MKNVCWVPSRLNRGRHTLTHHQESQCWDLIAVPASQMVMSRHRSQANQPAGAPTADEWQTWNLSSGIPGSEPLCTARGAQAFFSQDPLLPLVTVLARHGYYGVVYRAPPLYCPVSTSAPLPSYQIARKELLSLDTS